MRRLAEIVVGDTVAIRRECRGHVWFNLAVMTCRKSQKDYVRRLSDGEPFIFDAVTGRERGNLDTSSDRTLCRATPRVVAMAVDDLPEGVTRTKKTYQGSVNRG